MRLLTERAIYKIIKNKENPMLLVKFKGLDVESLIKFNKFSTLFKDTTQDLKHPLKSKNIKIFILTKKEELAEVL